MYFVVQLNCIYIALVICIVHSLCSIYDTIVSIRSSIMVACVVCSTQFFFLSQAATSVNERLNAVNVLRAKN